MSAGYRFLEHTTDAEVESYGATLEEAFENAALALEDTMVNVRTVQPRIEEEIQIKGKDIESLLYSWLEALIVKQETEGMVYSKVICKISKNETYTLEAKISGEKLDRERHEEKTAVKAPTYHGMKIKENPQQVTLRFILDL